MQHLINMLEFSISLLSQGYLRIPFFPFNLKQLSQATLICFNDVFV